MNAAERIERAKAELAAGDYQGAQSHALIAIAELLAEQPPTATTVAASDPERTCTEESESGPCRRKGTHSIHDNGVVRWYT